MVLRAMILECGDLLLLFVSRIGGQ